MCGLSLEGLTLRPKPATLPIAELQSVNEPIASSQLGTQNAASAAGVLARQ
jgi:hypothetical protein